MAGLYLASVMYQHLSGAAAYIALPNPLHFFHPSIMTSLSMDDFFLTGVRWEDGFAAAERPAGELRLTAGWLRDQREPVGL